MKRKLAQHKYLYVWRGSIFYNVSIRKPKKNWNNFRNEFGVDNKYLVFFGLPEMFESQTGIVLKVNECKRVLNLWRFQGVLMAEIKKAQDEAKKIEAQVMRLRPWSRKGK